MIEIIKELDIEVSKPNIFQALVAKQYDMNTRFLKVTLKDSGTRIDIPNSETAKVVINAERKDGQSKGFDGVINDDGTVTVPLHSWMLELEGTVICDISVIDIAAENNKKLTTTSFTLIVEKAAYGGDDVTNDPQYDVIVGLLADCNNATDEAKGYAEQSKQYHDETKGYRDSTFICASEVADRRNEAEQFSISAFNSKNSAFNYADEAGKARDEAKACADQAREDKDFAQTYMNGAGDNAISASNYAGQSQQYRNESKDYADSAFESKEAAQRAEDAAVTAQIHAETAQGVAEGYAEQAKQYMEQAEDNIANALGDIDLALDRIIEIQESLIGGVS